MSSEKITTVCISTCNRPEHLSTALSGLIGNLSKYNRTPRILISDDSEEGKHTSRIREIILEIGKNYTGAIEVIDRNDRKQMAIDLAKEKGIEEDVLTFAFCGDKTSATTLGSSQNSLFMKTKGEKIIFVDDDVLYNFFTLVKEEDPVFSLENEINYSPIVEGDSFPTDFRSSEIDILGIHEKVLGQKMSKVLGDNMPPYSLDYEIIDSYMGSYGDSPMESHMPILMLPQVYNKLGGVSAERYQAMKETRRIIQSVPGLTINQGIMCISMVMGIDNRNFVPPFMPNGRAQDLVFGTMRWKAFPLKVSAYLPTLIGHERPSKEQYKSDFNTVKEMTKMNRYISSIIYSVSNVEIDPATNIKNIGDHIVDISSKSDEEFREFTFALCTKKSKELAIKLNDLTEKTAGAPSFWRDDLQKMAETLYTPDPTFLVADVTRGIGQDIPTLRKWMNQYGCLLQAWGRLF